MYRGISALFVDKFAPSFDGIIPDPGDPGEGGYWDECDQRNISITHQLTPSFCLLKCLYK